MSEIVKVKNNEINGESRTFVHDIVSDLSIDKERLKYLDLSEREISLPPFGFSVGENKFMIGAGKRNPDAQFLITDKLLHCTGLVIEAEDEERFLLAHVMSTNFVSAMFENFRESLGNPERVKSITVVPGYHRFSHVDTRIKNIITESDKLKPDTLQIDIASGKNSDFRGLVVDTIGGGIYGLRQPVSIESYQRFSTEWNRSII